MHFYNLLSDISKDNDFYKIVATANDNSISDIAKNNYQQYMHVLHSFIDFLRNNRLEKLSDENSNISCNGIEGYLTVQDIFALYSMALTLPKNAIIYEIGSYMGLSTYIMASALNTSNNSMAKIYCVDLWEISPVEVFYDNLKRAGLEQLIVPIRRNSIDASELFQNHSADLVFLDADHTYEGSYADLNAWYPKVKHDGVFMGHDYYDNGVDQVQKAVSRFVYEKNLLSNFDKPLFGSFTFFIFPALGHYRKPLFDR